MRNSLVHDMRNESIDVSRVFNVCDLNDIHGLVITVDFFQSLWRERCEKILETGKLHGRPSFLCKVLKASGNLLSVIIAQIFRVGQASWKGNPINCAASRE
ncbi:MAG: hypothetical protein IKC03_06030 [Oscillospiraceae bacterium]|nr:hypothetical protein [Oscillospiraceae bacterium]